MMLIGAIRYSGVERIICMEVQINVYLMIRIIS